MLDRDPSTIVRAIREAGVVGAGGAGFPTHVKAASRVDLVIANGAECEPLLSTDKSLMALYPARVVEGLRLMMRATGATRGVLATKGHHHRVVEALRPHVQGLPDVELHLLGDFYPSGDEHVLVHEVTGRIVPEGGIPLDVGVVVSNVATLLDVVEAVFHGRPVTHRLVTVAGWVRLPSLFRVPVGTPIGALVEAAGGAPVQPFAVVVGGPMMGVVAPNLNQPVTKVTGGLVVVPPDHPLVVRKALDLPSQVRRARSACCGCRMCTEMCPRHLLGHSLEPHRVMRAISEAPEGAVDDLRTSRVTQAYLCSQCNVCEAYACPMGLSPRAVLRELRERLVRAGVQNPHRRRPAAALPAQTWTRVPLERLKARLGLLHAASPDLLAHEPITVDTGTVTIPLRQHVGAAAIPVVEAGKHVVAGQMVGEIPEGKLGARVHASIGGVVRSLDGGNVVIERVLPGDRNP